MTAEALRDRLGEELDALGKADVLLYVSSRGRLAAVVLEAAHYAGLIERLRYLEDSVAALTARDERKSSVLWNEVREPDA